MTGGPIDTIREALLNRPHSQTQPWNEAMAALTELEQQLAVLTDDRDQLRELNRLLENDLHAVLSKDKAAETALREKDTECADWYGKALAAQHDQEQAEQRANALADALREILRRPRAWAHVQGIARAALDRHTHQDKAVT